MTCLRLAREEVIDPESREKRSTITRTGKMTKPIGALAPRDPGLAIGMRDFLGEEQVQLGWEMTISMLPMGVELIRQVGSVMAFSVDLT